MALNAGSRIAQYRLERKLGAGGMGEVYLARDEKLNRLVAIKLLTAADEGAKRRLAREARAAAGLDHPGICAVYEVGSDEAVGDFIAMQYIEGETLAARLRRGRMSPDEAMGIGAQIAEALVAAHRHGLVHRDLKPQNVIITPTGSARLLDFGLALHVPTTTEAANAVTSSRVTDPNMVLGTPSYMSPEQVRNEPADFRSDVFSLGCVLYECLTGGRAFGGATTAEVLGAILHVDPPPVSSVAKSLGPAYDATCARMLEKIPSERFQSAEEALGAIRALTPSRSSPAPHRVPARKPERRRGQLAAAATLLVIAGWAFWQWQQPKALPTPTKEALDWYTRGSESMRDGNYAAARDAFNFAIQRFTEYPQAYARLAEAYMALEDQRSASSAALQAAGLIRNKYLNAEDALRYDAARESSLKNYPAALAAYQQLASRKIEDAGRLLDVGRVQEWSGQRAEAQVTFATVVKSNRDYAAAHLRLGVLQAQTGDTQNGVASIDTAIQLYRAAGQSEGEAEARLRKGVALSSSVTELKAARDILNQVMGFASDSGYASQRIRAQFELARLATIEGSFDVAEGLAQRALTEATAADLPTFAAAGLVAIGNVQLQKARYPEAAAVFVEGQRIAESRDAERIKNRSLLGQASAKSQLDKHEEALALAAGPLLYFRQTNDTRLENTAKAITTRSYEGLERYADAQRIVTETLQFAQSKNDNGLKSASLENLASLLTRQGRFPEALATRAEQVTFDRQIENVASLGPNLASHAELLILMGRNKDANPLLAEIESKASAGIESFLKVRPRVNEIRAMQATIAMRYADTMRILTPAVENTGRRLSTILVEHARARTGQGRTDTSIIAGWLTEPGNPPQRRERTYWIAQTLLARGSKQQAFDLASKAVAEPACQANAEQAWRLAAVAYLAASSLPSATAAERARYRELARTKAAELESGTWAPAFARYVARADLAALRGSLR